MSSGVAAAAAHRNTSTWVANGVENKRTDADGGPTDAQYAALIFPFSFSLSLSLSLLVFGVLIVVRPHPLHSPLPPTSVSADAFVRRSFGFSWMAIIFHGPLDGRSQVPTAASTAGVAAAVM